MPASTRSTPARRRIQQEVYEIGKRHGDATTCATGSRRSTRSCSARPRGRASAPSSRLRPADTAALIGQVLAGRGSTSRRPEPRGIRPRPARSAPAGSRSMCSISYWASSGRSTRCSPATRSDQLARAIAPRPPPDRDHAPPARPARRRARRLSARGAEVPCGCATSSGWAPSQLLFLGRPAARRRRRDVALATRRAAFARGLANAVLRRVAREGRLWLGSGRGPPQHPGLALADLVQGLWRGRARRIAGGPSASSRRSI